METSNDQAPALLTQKTAIIHASDRGIKFTSFEDLYRFSVAVSNSGTFPDIASPEAALVRIQAGLELGLSPIWSITNIMVENGRPSIWGDALLGLVLGHPDCIDVLETFEGEGEALIAICEVQRRGRVPVIRKFSVAEAKKAGLYTRENSLHSKYGKRMLQMRARSFACRDAFADVLRGLGMIEEMRDTEIKPARVREIRKPNEDEKIVLPDEIQPKPPTATAIPTVVQCNLFHDAPACEDAKCWIKLDAKKSNANKEDAKKANDQKSRKSKKRKRRR